MSGLAQFTQPNYRYRWPLPCSPWRPQLHGDVWSLWSASHVKAIVDSSLLPVTKPPRKNRNYPRFFVLEHVETTAAGLMSAAIAARGLAGLLFGRWR